MTRVNQCDASIIETPLFECTGDLWNHYSDEDRNDAIALLCARLKVTIVRTNATKHGNVELKLRERT